MLLPRPVMVFLQISPKLVPLAPSSLYSEVNFADRTWYLLSHFSLWHEPSSICFCLSPSLECQLHEVRDFVCVFYLLLYS